MKLKLSEWASIAEVLSAIAIVISLVFVGLQVSDGSRATRAATSQAASDQTMFLQSEILRYAGTWQKVLEGEALADGEELRRGIVLFDMVMTENENRSQQFESGYLADRRTNLEMFVGLPIYDLWRASPGANGQPAEFLELLDEISGSMAH